MRLVSVLLTTLFIVLVLIKLEWISPSWCLDGQEVYIHNTGL